MTDLCLYGNFVCHVTTMQQAGLIVQETMVDAIAHMQKAIGSRSPRGPYADPIPDLAVSFPSLELTTMGVPHSRTHEAEESRLQTGHRQRSYPQTPTTTTCQEGIGAPGVGPSRVFYARHGPHFLKLSKI